MTTFIHEELKLRMVAFGAEHLNTFMDSHPEFQSKPSAASVWQVLLSAALHTDTGTFTATGQQLSEWSGLSKVTVSQSLQVLLACGLLTKMGSEQTGKRGRPATIYHINMPEQPATPFYQEGQEPF